jgi:hypothetical protein
MATKFKHPIIIVDLIVYSGGLGANGWIVYMMIDELGLLVGLTSPCFIIIPAILHLSLWFFIVQMLILSSRASDEPLM